MKRICLTILACLLLLSLCACAGNETPTEPVSSQGSTTEATEQISDSTAAVADTTEAAQEPTDPKALANSCLEKSVDDLYALIGQPQSSDYAPSCLGPGEDGMLYYDGFIVYTYRENGVETVDYVE